MAVNEGIISLCVQDLKPGNQTTAKEVRYYTVCINFRYNNCTNFINSCLNKACLMIFSALLVTRYQCVCSVFETTLVILSYKLKKLTILTTTGTKNRNSIKRWRLHNFIVVKYYLLEAKQWRHSNGHLSTIKSDFLRGDSWACFSSLHFILFTKKFQHSSKHKYMHNVRNATYNSLGGCSKAQSELTTYPYKEKEK